MMPYSDTLEDANYPLPEVPNWQQAIELVAASNEVGRALGWRRPTVEEREMMAAAAEACLNECMSDTPTIPGML